MALDYGNQVSRTLQSEDRNFETVVWNKGKPPLDSELNLMSEIQNEHSRRGNIRLQSGVINFRLAGFDELYKGTMDLVFPSAFLGENEFVIQNFRAIVNGWVVDVIDSSVEGGNFTQDGWISVEMPSPPAAGQRQDLVFLEVFRALIRPNSTVNKPAVDKIYKYGNTQYRGLQLDDTMLDPAVGVETTQRVQLQFRLRTVSGVNFTNFPEGVDDPTVKARGPNTGDTSYTYTNQGSTVEDYGLFRSGNGDATSRSVLGTVDGYIWAIPILGVHRRNTTAYNVHTNPNGSGVSVGDSAKSDRPDSLLNDEINVKDIMDLRHLVLDDEAGLSEMVESNFDQLLKGWGQNTWGNDYVGAQKGVKLLQVDGVSAVDQPGIYDIMAPDGFRRSFADRSVTQNVARNFTQGVDNTLSNAYVSFAYTAVGNTLVISTGGFPNGIPTSPLPTMRWRSTGNTVALVAGWSVVGAPTQISAAIDPADPNYLPGGVIDIVFYFYYGRTAGTTQDGLRHVPNQGYYAFNANIAQNERMGFTYLEYETRDVGIFETTLAAFPVLGGNQDYIQDLNPETSQVNYYLNPPGALRNYNGFMQGNGSATYPMPSSLAGFEIITFYRFWDYTNPLLPVQIHPSSVTKTVGGFTVVFGQIFTTNQIIKYEAILRVKNLQIERHAKGIIEIYQAEQKTQNGDGTNNYDVIPPSGQIIVRMGTYSDLLGLQNNYAYVNGIRRSIIVNRGEGTGCVNVTFPGAPPGITDQIIFEFVSTYAPPSGDRLQFYYEFDPYQGLGLDVDGATIKQVSQKGLAHTVGTGGQSWFFSPLGGGYQMGLTDIETPSISVRLPLAGSRLDGDLLLDIIQPLDSSIQNGLRRLDLYESIKQPVGLYTRTTSFPAQQIYTSSTGFEEGLKLRVTTPFGNYSSPLPNRGVTDAWVVDKGTGVLDPYFLSAHTVTLESPGPAYYQSVYWMLICLPPEDELYLVVLTNTMSGSAISQAYSDYSLNGYSAYDVYRLKYRPLLSRR